MGQTAKELRVMWRARYTKLLDMIFEEFASDEIMLWPDEAMGWMDDLLENMVSDRPAGQEKETSRPPADLRFSHSAYRRDAHHYAVDRFYKTYFPRKRGGEPLPTSYVDRILELRFRGLNYVAIAEKLGQPKGKMRKQVEAAEKRWFQAVRRIEELKRKYPQMVAPDPRITDGKNRKPQSNGQKASKRAGK